MLQRNVHISAKPAVVGHDLQHFFIQKPGIGIHQAQPDVFGKGVRQLLDEGAIAGFPLQDVRVTLYDGKFHPVDSKDIAFATAGRKAFIEAIEKARPVILEPIVKIRILAQNSAMGDLAGDLSGRRGRVLGSDSTSLGQIAINGEVPLAELEGYESRLKSITGGEGTYSIELSHYEAVPATVQKQLQDAFHRSEGE